MTGFSSNTFTALLFYWCCEVHAVMGLGIDYSSTTPYITCVSFTASMAATNVLLQEGSFCFIPGLSRSLSWIYCL